jgi:hypothetical protein
MREVCLMIPNAFLAASPRGSIVLGSRPLEPLATAPSSDVLNPLWMSLPPTTPYPVQQDPVTREFPKEQRFIGRLTRLGVAAAEGGRGLPFLTEVSRVIWSGEIDNWHEGDHVSRAASRAGLDLDELDAAITAAPNITMQSLKPARKPSAMAAIMASR